MLILINGSLLLLLELKFKSYIHFSRSNEKATWRNVGPRSGSWGAYGTQDNKQETTK